MSGETTIRHEEKRWLFDGVLRVKGDRPALHRSFSEILGLSLALALPCTAGLILLREPIVALLFGWNPDHFGSEAVRLCGLALLYYTLGLVPISLARIYVLYRLPLTTDFSVW